MGDATTLPARATGVTGRPALRPGLAHSPVPVGYDATQLDPLIADYIAVVERAVGQVKALGDKLEPLIRNADLDDPAAATLLYDRMAKAALNVTKALDELSRLRSFVDGGPDSSKELTAKSEVELRAMLLTALPKLGLRVVDITPEGEHADA
jgi:hypothetical protein